MTPFEMQTRFVEAWMTAMQSWMSLGEEATRTLAKTTGTAVARQEPKSEPAQLPTWPFAFMMPGMMPATKREPEPSALPQWPFNPWAAFLGDTRPPVLSFTLSWPVPGAGSGRDDDGPAANPFSSSYRSSSGYASATVSMPLEPAAKAASTTLPWLWPLGLMGMPRGR